MWALGRVLLLLLRGGGAIYTNQVRSPLAHCVGHYLGPLQVFTASFLFFFFICMDYWPYSASLRACCKYVASLIRLSLLTTEIIVFLFQKSSFKFLVENAFFHKVIGSFFFQLAIRAGLLIYCLNYCILVSADIFLTVRLGYKL